MDDSLTGAHSIRSGATLEKTATPRLKKNQRARRASKGRVFNGRTKSITREPFACAAGSLMRILRLRGVSATDIGLRPELRYGPRTVQSRAGITDSRDALLRRIRGHDRNGEP